MKPFRYFTILLFLSTLLISCEKDSEEIEDNGFQKEGELRILKADNELVKVLNIEIADTDLERQTGLMHREHLQDDQAMLFIYPNSAPRFFYMKNTIIPLDIIYFDSNKTAVSFQENAKPMDETPLPSGAPAQYVLEINAGLSRTWGLEVGDRIEYEITPE